MKTQFRLCSSRLAASFLLLLSLLINTSMAGPIEDARAAAGNSGIQALGLYGTKSGSNANISVPMTNSNTPLNTIDNSTPFTANLTSPSSSKFLEMLIQPSSTGDLQQVIISQDLNTDDVFDNVFGVPRVVSGVCANGYISCAPGTWSNCVSYKWVADVSGRVNEVVVPIMDLGGCYCINNSCGSNLVWMNSSIVLKDLAGGVLGAIQSSNINFTITNVSYTPITIAYYGNVTGNPATAVSSLNNVITTPPISVLQTYLGNVGALSSDINGNVTTQSLNSDSMYSQLLGVSQSGNKSACHVNRNLTVSPQQNFCYEPPFPGQLDEIQTHDYLKIDTGRTGRSDNNCDCYYTLIFDNIGCFPYTAATVTTLPLGAVDTGQEAVDDFFDPVGVAPTTCSYHIYRYYDTCIRHANAVNEVIDNQCSALETSSNCSLSEEKVDGVDTFLNGLSTGKEPLASCNTYTTTAGQVNICRPWWNKTRTYLCHNNPPWSFDDMRTRYNTVANSVTQGGSYSDTLKGANGAWTSSSGTLIIPNPPPVAPCELSCKTKMTTGSTQVLVNGLISARNDPSNATNYAYKLCVNNACPLDPGEEIVDDCNCLSDFTQAYMSIQAVRMGAKDFICTTGVPHELP